MEIKCQLMDEGSVTVSIDGAQKIKDLIEQLRSETKFSSLFNPGDDGGISVDFVTRVPTIRAYRLGLEDPVSSDVVFSDLFSSELESSAKNVLSFLPVCAVTMDQGQFDSFVHDVTTNSATTLLEKIASTLSKFGHAVIITINGVTLCSPYAAAAPQVTARSIAIVLEILNGSFEGLKIIFKDCNFGFVEYLRNVSGDIEFENCKGLRYHYILGDISLKIDNLISLLNDPMVSLSDSLYQLADTRITIVHSSQDDLSKLLPAAFRWLVAGKIKEDNSDFIFEFIRGYFEQNACAIPLL